MIIFTQAVEGSVTTRLMSRFAVSFIMEGRLEGELDTDV